jgi:UDP-glucuronate 4-epimerase
VTLSSYLTNGTLSGCRTVVTGVAGFVASHVAEALLGHGSLVTGVDRRTPATDAMAAANLADCLAHPSFTFVPVDLADCALEPLLLDVDAVFHLAAIPGVRPSWGTRFSEYVTCNIIATKRLAETCDRLGVPRLVVASSSSVYGQTIHRPCRETDPTRPSSLYGVTKLASEQLCLAYASRPHPGTTVVALRYFTVYGPRQRPDMLIHRALRAVLDGQTLQIYGDGTQRRDFTYIDDAVSATVAAATVPATAEVLNIGGGSNTSVAEVLDLVTQLSGRSMPIEYAPTHAGDVYITLADPTKAQAVLGWHSHVDISTGVARQLAWMTP